MTKIYYGTQFPFFMQGIDAIFYIVVLIMSVVVHEVAHGFAAEAQGDPTARFAGRLTLNPLKHIDLVGSVILPLFLLITHAGFIIGWAKPVPYSEANLRNKRWGSAIVASAGILTNICIAIIFGIAIRYAAVFGSGSQAFISIASVITLVNLLLALFNLIPIPPLDGSKILFSILSARQGLAQFQSRIEYLALPLLLVFIIFIWPAVVPAIGFAFTLLTGIPLSL